MAGKRFFLYKVKVSGEVVGTFSFEKTVMADNAEQAARNVRKALQLDGLDLLHPKTTARAKMKVRKLKTDSVLHTSGDE